MALSELHLALIGAGTVGVLLVWGYNVWQDRKHRKVAERIFESGKPDALAGSIRQADDGGADSRVEPRLEPAGETAAGVEEADPPLDSIEPIEAVPHAEAGATPNVASADALPHTLSDPVADLAIRLRCPQPVAVPIAHSVLRSWVGSISKPVLLIARDEGSGQWQEVASEAGGSHRDWALSVQLVDRRGAIAAGELAAFSEGASGLARQMGATIDDVLDIDEVAGNAGALDQFCAGVDIQFVLHVVDGTGGTFAGTKLRGLAEAAGLVLEGDGLFHARDEARGEEFNLGNLAGDGFTADNLRAMTTHGITFTIDVPRVSNGPAAFERMLASARQLAVALGGVLVDAQRAPLSEQMIAAIRAKIVELQQRMRDAGIDPGGPRALRLFS